MFNDSILHDLNRRFDHAALHSETTEADIHRLCNEAITHNFYSVAVNPIWTATAVSLLKNSDVQVLGVSGFPLGAIRTDSKIDEAVRGVEDGATEIDMVANIGWIVSGQMNRAESEIAMIRKALPKEVVLKVIIEAGKLDTDQQITATKAVIHAGAQFVKTCTGFFGGATVDQVTTLHNTANGQIEVKASGGIRTLEDSLALLKAGATRLGSSASPAIVRKWQEISNSMHKNL